MNVGENIVESKRNKMLSIFFLATHDRRADGWLEIKGVDTECVLEGFHSQTKGCVFRAPQ